MPILTRQERERLVLKLYSQGKNIREIAKEARMSFRDIGVILNKVMEEKKIEGGEEEQQQYRKFNYLTVVNLIQVIKSVLSI